MFSGNSQIMFYNLEKSYLEPKQLLLAFPHFSLLMSHILQLAASYNGISTQNSPIQQAKYTSPFSFLPLPLFSTSVFFFSSLKKKENWSWHSQNCFWDGEW